MAKIRLALAGSKAALAAEPGVFLKPYQFHTVDNDAGSNNGTLWGRGEGPCVEGEAMQRWTKIFL